MSHRILGILAFFALPAVFVYLIGAFLISTFDINFWFPAQRFFAVVVYLYILSLIVKVFSDSNTDKKAVKDNKESEVTDVEERDVTVV